MAAGIRALARKNGISGEMEETMEMRFGESERSELRRVPSISEQIALKVMEEGSRRVLDGLGYESRKTPSLEI
jgi:hypothetical protein